MSNLQGPLAEPVPPDLGQRSRAGLEVLGSINVVAFNTLRKAAREHFYATPEGKALAEESKTPADSKTVRDRVERAKALAGQDSAFRLERFLQRYTCEEKWERGIAAAEEKRDGFKEFIVAPPGEPIGKLELDPSLPTPKFYNEVEFHLQPGGWDGYDLYGPALSYGIYPLMFARGGFASMPPVTPKNPPYRDRIMKMLPRSDYKRIFDVGCGSGSMTRWAHVNFPQAEIVACDLSAVLLKSGHAVAERAGIPITFKQVDGRATGEPEGSFDLVIHNAVAHELPPKANLEVFREMFRILAPGGDILVMDPPPFRDVDPFSAVILDWETEHDDEPFFSTALLTDWDEELRKIGFVDVRSTVVDGVFPWVLIAHKAEETA
jgi:SAM-dependent methyltransferase